jgi:D-threo-aldose 1-dehydrogenase
MRSRIFHSRRLPNNVLLDYTADGACRSIEDSLQRMGVSRLDIAFVHDISSDDKLLPTPWQEQFAIALKGAFRTSCMPRPRQANRTSD